MGNLQDFVSSRQRYVKLGDGEEFQGFFIGANIIPDKFKIKDDTKATTVEYSFKTKDDRDMNWTCGNVGVANKLMKAKEGQEIRIKRIGLGAKTVYDVVLVDAMYDGELPPF